MKHTTDYDEKKNLTTITIDQEQPITEDVLRHLGATYRQVVRDFAEETGLEAEFFYRLGLSTQQDFAGVLAEHINKTIGKRYKAATGERRDLADEIGTPVQVKLSGGKKYGSADEQEIFEHLQQNQTDWKFLSDEL